MRCEIFNNTSLSQNCILNIFASLEFPHPTYCEVSVPSGAILKTANNYVDYTYAVDRPWDEENPDGMFKGMFADKDFYLGKGLGDRCENYHVHFLNLQPFGCVKGDKVSYSFEENDIKDPVIAVRYKSATDGDAEFDMNGTKVAFPHSDELAIAYIPYMQSFTLESLGTAGIEFDFLCVVEKSKKDEIKCINKPQPYMPEIETKVLEKGHIT